MERERGQTDRQKKTFSCVDNGRQSCLLLCPADPFQLTPPPPPAPLPVRSPLNSCEVALGSDAFSSSPASSGCIVTVTSSNTAGAGQRPLVVRVGQWEAEVPITVWFPEAVALTVPDPVLNRIVPSESSQVILIGVPDALGNAESRKGTEGG